MRTCADCSQLLPAGTHGNLKRCPPCGRARKLQQWREGSKRRKRPDVPCSGCGQLMWTGTGSLPPDRRLCQPCRRASPWHSGSHQAKPVPTWRELTCKCGALFTTRVAGKKWCTPSCRLGYTPTVYKNRTNESRRGRYGNTYRKLRLRVIYEETVCWICDVPVDKACRWPDPLSPSLDHVIPLSLGGECLDRENCRLAHLRCNRLRANQLR